MINTPTYYKNQFRTITGLTNVVFDSDVVLLCDTTLGAVNLNLLEIPLDRFSTQYKLYIVDKSNNAGTNNITITAPIGFSVNNSSVAVINVNNGVAVITISSNTTYNAQFNYIVGGGGAIVVKNEGTIITSNATSFNFVGADINATAIGGDVTINVQSSLVALTYVQLQALITTNSLIPSQQYLITDAIFTVTVTETVPIVVTAITINEISLSGSGLFLNADYDSIGVYIGVTGFVAQLGIWNNALTPVVGDVCIWNNYHWLNITGVNTVNNPSIDAVNWSLLPKSSTNGYITEIDNINYKVSSNNIIYREDVRNNKVENNFNSLAFKEAFAVFQWGSNKTYNNIVLGESYIECYNWTGQQFNNTCINFSFIETYKTGNVNVLRSNTFNNSKITFDNLGVFGYNTIVNNTSLITISIDTIPSNFINNTITGGLNNLFDLAGTSEFKDNIFNSDEINTILVKNANGKFNSNFVSFSNISIDSNRNSISNNIISNAFSFEISVNNGNINLNEFNYPKLLINLNDLAGEINNNYLDDSSFRVTNNQGFIIHNSGVFASFGILTNVGSINNNIVNSSQISTTLNTGTIRNNFIEGSNLTPITNSSSIYSNTLKNSTLNLNSVSNPVLNNQFYDSPITILNVIGSLENNNWINCDINITGTLGADVINTWVQSGNISVVNISTKIIGGIYQQNVGTIAYNVDMNDPTVYDLPTQTLTLPSGLQNFIGEWWLYNNGGKPISKIVNLNQISNYATKFVGKELGLQLNFTAVAIGVAVFNSIISNTAPTTYKLIPRVSGEDSIYIRRSGDFNAVEQVYIYI